MPVSHRTATPSDAAFLADLGRRSFAETFGHLYSPENLAAFLLTHNDEDWGRELRDPAFAVRLAEEDGKAAAYAKIGPVTLSDASEGAIELRQFYLLKPWHRTGLSSTLMQWVLDEARRRGGRTLYLSVFIDNQPARRFYERYGFEQVGRYAFMVGSHADEDLIMRLTLEE